ncbi:MAG: DUF3619 family protein [Dechloromonas sp.]|nr:DUF3619 family protein [Dechloromonas sp.]
MNEERYAYRVRQALNQGLKDIPPSASRRLEAARHLALAKQKQAKPQLALAGGGRHVFGSGSPPRYFKQALSVIALLLGMWLSFYWHSVQYVTELQDVDSALLADDLPPEAFLDNNFFEWLKDDSSEE